MDYERAYKQALERAKQFSEKPYQEDSAGIVEYIFPELKESEDEKMANIIREALANVTSENTLGKYGLSHSDVSDWLEKLSEQKAKYHDVCDKCTRQPTCQSDCFLQQGEQKPAWSEEDEAVLDALIRRLKGEDIYVSPHLAVKCLKSLKNRVVPQPKQEWNSGDDAHLHSLITLLEGFIASHPNTTGADIQGENVAWLKSLRPQNRWKPSDEQMNALSVAVKHGQTDDPDALKKLLEQLKKLREE